jgi:hypothetical protein
METRLFLHTKIVALAARARRLARVNYASVGIRPQDIPYAPSPEHFRAANRRLAKIDQEVQRRLEQVSKPGTQHHPIESCGILRWWSEKRIDRGVHSDYSLRSLGNEAPPLPLLSQLMMSLRLIAMPRFDKLPRLFFAVPC